MAATDRNRDVEVDYPNRRKAASKMTKAVVVLLLLASAFLMVVITLGGWEALQGAQIVQISYIALYVLSAYLIARWRSGMLPVVAALAVILLIFASVSGPEWFSRDKDGFTDPALDSSVLGLLTLLLVPVQVLLIAFAMSGFRQAWHVEVEIEPDDRGYERPGSAAPAPA
jgi:hypothetical protein